MPNDETSEDRYDVQPDVDPEGRSPFLEAWRGLPVEVRNEFQREVFGVLAQNPYPGRHHRRPVLPNPVMTVPPTYVVFLQDAMLTYAIEEEPDPRVILLRVSPLGEP